jgi:hypothetical protein
MPGMVAATENLPDDIETLKTLVQEKATLLPFHLDPATLD